MLELSELKKSFCNIFICVRICIQNKFGFWCPFLITLFFMARLCYLLQLYCYGSHHFSYVQTDLAHHHPYTKALKNLGNRSSKDEGGDIFLGNFFFQKICTIQDFLTLYLCCETDYLIIM